MNIAVTGASGYLGRKIVQTLRAQGNNVYPFVRNPVGDGEVKFSLSDISNIFGQFSSLKIDVLIHCAWDLTESDFTKSHDINVVNSINLFKTAKNEFNVRIIFISSMSSFEGCRSSYGKQKLEVEDVAIQMGGIVLRPGLIWGDDCTGGMFLTLNKLVKKLPCVPMIGSGVDVLYLSHVDDLSNLVCRIIPNLDRLNPCVITAASSQPVAFKKILQICASSNGKYPIFIPIPHLMILWPLKVFELLRIKLPIRSDSVIGLIYSDRNPTFEKSKYLEINFFGFRNFNKKELVNQ